MAVSNIVKYRLINQQIFETNFKKPGDLVTWFVGLQAQSYNSAKWAIGSRLPAAKDIDVEQAIADKKIIRTWLMRGTLHMVATEDIRWLLTLLSPRILAKMAPRNRQLGLDKTDFTKANTAFKKALKGGKQLTRDELAAVLFKAGIETNGLRLSHLLMGASLEQVICSGSRRGNQFTFTLFDEWVPKANPVEREKALAEIARRYFISRGPATLQDFIWWSGLSATEARSGLENAKQWLIKEKFGEEVYWLSGNMPAAKNHVKTTNLLAGFDEYIISYKDRTSCLDAKYASQVIKNNGIFNPAIITDGIVVGTWRPEIIKNKVVVQTNFFNSLNKSREHTIISEAEKYARFLNKTLGV